MHEFIVPGDYIPFIDHAIVRLSFLFPSQEEDQCFPLKNLPFKFSPFTPALNRKACDPSKQDRNTLSPTMFPSRNL